MRKVFLDELPKKIHGDKEVISWKETIGCKVKFIYDDIEDELEIINYDKSKAKVFVKYNDKVFDISYAGLRNCYLGKIVGKKRVYSFNKSFYEWCNENNREDVIIRWDYDLNKFKPTEVSSTTHKKVWLRCPEGIHKSELRDIGNFTSSGRDGSISCNKCNSFGQHLINKYGEDAIEKYWSDKNDVSPFEISYSSRNKVWIFCQNCHNKKLIRPRKFLERGIGCPKCSDGISYCEKFMFNVLQQANANFKTQLSKTTFNWCKGDTYDYRYDFYCKIHNEDIVIETHGLQHYQNVGGTWINLETVKENDKSKRNIAIKNGIKKDNYIVINCRKTELEWIKQSIMSSKLSKLYDLSNINWLECHQLSTNSLIKTACELWNKGMKSIKGISQELNICQNTVRNYLKFGTRYGWCNYNPKIQSAIANVKNNSVKVICLNTREMFNSIIEATQYANLRSGSSICQVCKGKNKSAGKHPKTGEPLRWMYYEDYIEKYKDDSEMLERLVDYEG